MMTENEYEGEGKIICKIDLDGSNSILSTKGGK